MKYSILTLAILSILSFSVANAENSEALEKVPDQITLILDNKQITNKQQHILLKAYDIAKEDGHKDPELLPAVIFQETHAGSADYLKNKICYGISQVKLQAAKAVFKLYPELLEKYSLNSDSKIVKLLKTDEEFNMRVASKYLLMMEKYGGKSSAGKLAAYNLGPGGVRGINPNKSAYVKKVKTYMSEIKSSLFEKEIA